MALTAMAVSKAKAGEKAQRMADGGGMYLLIQPTGSKLWRMDYRFTGKRLTLALGIYPDVSLADARERRDQARKLLANGVDPSAAKQAQKASGLLLAANSFEVIAREWFAKFSSGWTEGHSGKVITRLENDVFPWLGSRPITGITPPELLSVVRRIEGRGALPRGIPRQQQRRLVAQAALAAAQAAAARLG